MSCVLSVHPVYSQSRDNIYVWMKIFTFVQNVSEYLQDHTPSHPINLNSHRSPSLRYHFLRQANLLDTSKQYKYEAWGTHLKETFHVIDSKRA
jgi:hypothetical protein